MTRIKLCQKIITALQYICNHEISCYINIMQYHAIPHTVQGNIHTFEKVYLTRTRTNTVEKKRIENAMIVKFMKENPMYYSQDWEWQLRG